MFKRNLQRGFTLIELLVVIAIIGILASVVLASLNTARSKGADAAVKSNLANIRAQAEILYDTSGNYSTVCSDTTIAAALAAAASAGGATGGVVVPPNAAQLATTLVCHLSAANDAWVVQGPLKSSGMGHWCVDSTGRAKANLSVLPAAATACP